MRIWKIIAFGGFYFKELVQSNLLVLKDIFTPRDLAQPKILEMPLDVSGDVPLFLLTNLITITPGTICIDVTDDGKTLLVQDLYSDDPDAAVQHLKQNYERRVLELFN